MRPATYCGIGTILLFFLLTLSVSFAQAPPVDWDRVLGGSSWEEIHSINPTNDGGFLVAGITSSPPDGDVTLPNIGSWDFWLVKMTLRGEIEWQKRYGGQDEDRIWVSHQTRDGGYVVGGSSRSGISGTKTEASRGDKDFWLIRLDANGDLIWDKTIGGNRLDAIRGDIIEMPDGGFFIAGVSESDASGDKTQANRGDWDFWVVRVNRQGDIMWDKTYGGDDKDVLQAVLPMADGGFLLGGSSESGISGDKDDFLRGLNDFWIIRIDRNGRMLWQKTIGGNWDEQIFDMAQAENGTIYLVGFSGSDAGFEKTNPSYGSHDYWLVAIDPDGNKLWDKNYGGQKPDDAYDIRINRDGNIIIAGIANSEVSGSKESTSEGKVDYWLVYLTPDGEQIWDESYGASLRDALTEIEILSDGSILMAGHTESQMDGDKTEESRGVNDIWLVKTSCDLGSVMPEMVPTCPTDAIELDAAFTRCYDCRYTWENGDSTQLAMIQNLTPETTYSVTVTDINACINIDSTLVSFQYPQAVALEIYGEYCEQGMRVEEVRGGNAPYLYGLDGERFGAINEFPFLPTGEHTLYLVDSLGCTLDTTFTIEEFEDLVVELGESQFLELGDSLHVEMRSNRPIERITWHNIKDATSCPDCPKLNLLPLESATISIEVEDEFGCVASDVLSIHVERAHEIYMPNGFTPNNDGINDWFNVYTGKDVEEVLNFKIFDRRGHLVFENPNPGKNNPLDGWDGYFKGRKMPEGVYLCVAEVRFIDGYQSLYTVDVALMR